MTEPGNIVGGLSEAQRKALVGLSKYPEDRSVTFSVRVGYALERKGLAARTLLSDRAYLTPLGLAVRNHILTEQKEAG